MNGPNPDPLRTPTGADNTVLAEQVGQLQRLFVATLVALILMSAAVAFFIEKQVRLVKQQIAEQRPSLNRMMTDYQKGYEPVIRNFSSALAQFAATNRDFQPILEKYRPVLSNYFGAPLPGAVPATNMPTNPAP